VPGWVDANWVDAAASLLTVVLALVLLRRQAAALDVQRRSLLDAQAHRVSAWAASQPEEGEAGDLRWFRLTIVNSGDEAVYGVRVISLLEGPSSRDETRRAFGSSTAVLPAHSEQVQLLPARQGSGDPAPARFELSFMDSRRSHWVRRWHGGLDRVSTTGEHPSALVVGDERDGWRLWGRRPARQKEERPALRY